MTKMPYIKWEPHNSVHVNILDEQHRKLFDIVNDLIDEMDSGSKNLLPIIRNLVNYSRVHFHQENMVMMDSNYPGFLKHSREHDRFIEKVEEFLNACKEKDANLERNMVIFLKDWIYTHTTKLDMQYADHLLNNADELGRIGKVKLNV